MFPRSRSVATTDDDLAFTDQPRACTYGPGKSKTQPGHKSSICRAHSFGLSAGAGIARSIDAEPSASIDRLGPARRPLGARQGQPRRRVQAHMHGDADRACCRGCGAPHMCAAKASEPDRRQAGSCASSQGWLCPGTYTHTNVR
jgi:hypothetical protein